jgi:hypothetical protein
MKVKANQVYDAAVQIYAGMMASGKYGVGSMEYLTQKSVEAALDIAKFVAEDEEPLESTVQSYNPKIKTRGK